MIFKDASMHLLNSHACILYWCCNEVCKNFQIAFVSEKDTPLTYADIRTSDRNVRMMGWEEIVTKDGRWWLCKDCITAYIREETRKLDGTMEEVEKFPTIELTQDMLPEEIQLHEEVSVSENGETIEETTEC